MARIPRHRPPKLISEYVQGRRVLPTNTPAPGPWENAKTPYLVEVMDCLSPYSPVQHVVVMKGAQLGVTAAAENVIGYWMDASPTEILYVSATQDLLEKWGAKRLEPLIDSLGFRTKITAQIENAKSRRTGDKTFSKQFVGGALDMASAQSAPSLRSDSKRVLVRDEIDGAPAQLVTGEGNWLDVSKARTNAWGSLKKLFDLSTPGVEDQSNIYPAYLEGDCRKYLVPCPACGHRQELEMGDVGGTKGLVPVMDDQNRLTDAVYICAACKAEIRNHEKPGMLSAGQWVPTKESSKATLRSYHVNSLYSPFMPWREIWEEKLKAADDPDGQRSFVNLYLGWPYKEAGAKPKIGDVLENVGTYSKETVPDGVLYLTIGADVQTGKDSRVELEVVGHGLGYRTWSVDYRVFGGPVADPFSGAWELMHEWAVSGGLNYKTADGRTLPVQLIFVDSGDGNMTDTVYRFCARWNNTYPSKGQGFIRANHDKKERGDVPGALDFKKYRGSQIGQSGQYLYLISTNHYKKIVYQNLTVKRSEDGTNPPGFMDFPMDYTEQYFKQLTAEEMRSDGSFHAAHKGVRTEALDCRVYALAAGDVWLDARVQEQRRWQKANFPQTTDVQLAQINGAYILKAMSTGTPRK